MGKHADFETTELLQIFRQFGIFRNTLPKEHAEFVKQQLQKDYDTVTKTYKLQGKVYTGTFRENAQRKRNREAYEKEAKLLKLTMGLRSFFMKIQENCSLST